MDNQKGHFTSIRKKIIETLDTAEFEIKIAVAWFTDTSILSELLKHSERGIKISIIINDDKINNKDLFKDLYYNSVDIRVSKKMMHNKFCIIDNKTLINGSYNWTNNAVSNEENIQISCNNENLGYDYSNQFENIQKNCIKIDEHFKYALDNVLLEEDNFIKFYSTVKNKNRFPYFFKQKLTICSKGVSNYKLEEGYYFIANDDDEYNFLRYKYYLKLNYNKAVIEKVSNKKFLIPTKIHNILDFENDQNEFYQILQDKYLVEELINNNYTGKRNFVYLINNKGEKISDKIQFSKKLLNGNYIKLFLNSPYSIINKELKTINLNAFPIIMDNMGVILCNKNDKYGLCDFDGNVLVDKNKFNHYTIISENIIMFHENPILQIRRYMSSGYPKFIVEKYIRCHYHKDAVNKNTFKPHYYHLNERKLIISNEIQYKELHSEYLFLSYDTYKCKEFYDKIYDSLNRELNKSDFLNLREIYAQEILKNENSKKDIADRIISNYIKKKQKEEEEKKRHQERWCYVATLVYGDISHPKVDFLRNYRDNVLSNYFFGKIFIKYYYNYSPKIVVFLKPHSKTNSIIKLILDGIIILLKKLTKKVNK